MSQRSERVAGEIRGVIAEVLARREIKDPRVRDAGIVTITHVRLSGDLREARVLFTVHGADAPALARVRSGLGSAAGYLRREIGRALHLKVTPALTFGWDDAFDQAAKVERLLREIGSGGKP